MSRSAIHVVILRTISSTVLTSPTGGGWSESESRARPTARKWPCASMKPGSSARSSSSTTRVASPRSAMMSSSGPAAAIVSPLTATASTRGCAESIVTIAPPRNIVSAGGRVSGVPPPHPTSAVASRQTESTHCEMAGNPWPRRCPKRPVRIDRTAVREVTGPHRPPASRRVRRSARSDDPLRRARRRFPLHAPQSRCRSMESGVPSPAGPRRSARSDPPW